MPTLVSRLAVEYLERAQRLRLAAEIAARDDTRRRLLNIAEEYELLAERVELVEEQRGSTTCASH
jgi:hypothetical protein